MKICPSASGGFGILVQNKTKKYLPGSNPGRSILVDIISMPILNQEHLNYYYIALVAAYLH